MLCINEDQEENLIKRYGLTMLTIAFFIMLIRLPGGLQAEQGILINVDELELTLSTVDRFLGLPATSLHWPGATLQFLASPVVLLEFIADTHYQISQNGFVAYISDLYREPWHTVMLLRYIVIFVSSVGFASLYIPLFYFTGSRLISIIAITILATLPMVWLHSHMATGDALSLGFACLAFSTLYLRENNSWVIVALAGSLLGLAVASKLTIVLLTPFVMSAALSRSPRIIKSILIFSLFLVLAFIFACPYVWTDPFRFAKSILGNVSKPGTPMGLVSSFVEMSAVTTIPLFLLSILGIYKLIERKLWLFIGGTVISLLLILIIMSEANVVYDRYYLPSVIPLTVLAGVGLSALKMFLQKTPIKYNKVLSIFTIMAIGAYLSVGSIFSYAAKIQKNKISAQYTFDVIKTMKQLNCQLPIAIPTQFMYYLVKDASSQSIRKLADQSLPFSPLKTVGEFAEKRGVSRGVVQVLGRALNEEEQVYSARLNAISYPDDRQGFDIIIWMGSADYVKNRFGALHEQEVISLWDDRKLCALVLHDNSVNLQNRENHRYGKYRLLANVQ